MKLTLAEPGYLKESISIISELVNEARFKVNQNAMELVAMDPANVAMVVFKLLSSSFIEYDIKKDTEIAINLSNLKQVLRRASPKDILTIELSEDNRFNIQLKSSTIRNFSLPLIALEEKEQKVPDLKFSVMIKTSSSLLNEAIDDVDVVGESVVFIAQTNDDGNKKFILQAEGDLNQARIEITDGDKTGISITSNETIKSKYSIEYLKKMINGSKLSDEVIIQFSKDYPLKLEYKTIDRVLLSFILAPRIENE